MSRYIVNNTALTYKISFEVDGEFVSPSSASITLTKNDGTVVGGINDTALTIPAEATSVNYTISGANNTSTLDYELRYITVKFVYNSNTYFLRDYYTIRDNLRIPVTASDVRILTGLSNSELSDDQIDIFAAYDNVQNDLTVNLATLLDDGSLLIPEIQNAIKARAALDSMLMVETLIFQSEQADNTLYKRFNQIDFEALLNRLRAMYSRALAKLEGIETGNNTSVTSFIVSTGVDPVTNE